MDYLWVDCDKKDVASVEQSLNTLISNTSHIKMDTYHAQLQSAEFCKQHDEAWLLSVYGGCGTHRFYEYGKHHDHEYYDKKAGIWYITGCGYDK